MSTFTTMEAGFAYLLSGAHDQELAAAARKRRAQSQTAATAGELWPAFSDWTAASPPVTTTPDSNSSLGKQPFRGDSVASGMDIFVPSIAVDPYAANKHTLARQVSETKEKDSEDIIKVPPSPYEMRHGKRYLRDVPYLLPVDLTELHRQSMRTLLGEQVFSKPVCAPLEQYPPKRVLEVGCGSAFWTSCCHEYLSSLGHKDVAFTGLDMAPIAPDLREQGIDWTFVLHNGRDYPWPFEPEAFDYIMIKDLSLAIPFANSQRFLSECLRLLAPNGHLEFWESDHVLRCLMPHHRPPPAGTDERDEEHANATRTFLITPGMPFVPAQNKYIQDSNSWIELACDKRKLPSTPCAIVAETLCQEPDLLCDFGSRRVAIPLTELPWEKERNGSISHPSGRKSSRSGPSGKSSSVSSGKSKSKSGSGLLTAEQAAIRQTALMTVVQKIESLEPVLKEFSGKSIEEWATWWANMMGDLLDQDGARTGECLEMGAWWARKRAKE
ncbi:hypothetical protein CAC42_1140 [Sphaceloma murrayae]|uniref:Methyltransferase domain-containing protein n=1 Tax=Sphaceloma murrayae TaxID=2082308 RepID=A0A2K1R253_9PEZI|nr:hypothetical protein CAC42_1140 [Sphaceloma murrayae]